MVSGIWCQASMQSVLPVMGSGSTMIRSNLLENLSSKHHTWTHQIMSRWLLSTCPPLHAYSHVHPRGEDSAAPVSLKKAEIRWRACEKATDCIHIIFTLFTDTVERWFFIYFRMYRMMLRKKAASNFLLIEESTKLLELFLTLMDWVSLQQPLPYLPFYLFFFHWYI